MKATPRTTRFGVDFWTLAFAQFRKHRVAVVASWCVGVLFLVAVFAPLVASDRPLLLDGPDGLASPALRWLSATDWTWIAGLFAAACGRVAYWALRRRSPERPAVLASTCIGLAVFIVGALVAHLEVKEIADRADWPTRAKAARAEGRTVLLAPIPFDPNSGGLGSRLRPPGENGNVLGTDGVGRDIAARMVWGTRISLIVGFVAVSLYVFIGVIVGSMAGYYGGRVDDVASRLIEVVQCFPTFFLILAVLAFVPPSIFNIMLLIGVTSWTGVARLVRGEFLRLKGQDFVTAGVALGASPRRLIFRHVLPNAMSPVLVSATLGVPAAILIEAGLSFLGFGVPPPTASWGSLLFDARPYVSTHPWLSLYPGLAIFFTVTAYNLVGEGLRDALDPRLAS